MKINGPNHTNFNPYKQQFEKNVNVKKASNRSDALEISKEAMKLQENDRPDEARKAKIQQLKQQVESGEYEVHFEKTAEKMIAFWRR